MLNLMLWGIFTKLVRGFTYSSKEMGQEAGNLQLEESYNERIRPLLDAVDTLRNFGIMKEGIQLPSIVVVGDQSAGKSSVLESLAGISLPKGQGICTRVPLIMRLQSCSKQETEISIEYNGTRRKISESQITEALNMATDEIAGPSKGISDVPITLNVRKVNAPDLTMVDLPGITRVPVHGQPQDIYEQISKVIMHYISPKESIILNVLSAFVDFPTCESIRMSQKVDLKGERTLAVVTKVDKAPEGLLDKVTVDAVNIGLGYVCVRNRVGNESNAQAREIEGELFKTDPHLSKIDKSMVGIPILAEKLMQIQAMSIRKSLPDIVKKIDVTLSKRESELNSLPRSFSNSAEAMMEFMKIMDRIRGILHKLLILGDTELFPDDPHMHCIAWLTKMFKRYYQDLHAEPEATEDNFLVEEVALLENAQGVSLCNFLPHSVFVSLLHRHIDSISQISTDLARQVCDCVDRVICDVIDMQTAGYPQLQSASRRAFQALIDTKRAECIQQVEDIMEMQKSIVFTENPSYLQSLRKLVELKNIFMKAVEEKRDIVELQGIGIIELAKVAKSSGQLEAALDMKMSLIAYWRVVKLRMADEIPLRLRFICQKMVQSDLLSCIVKEVMGHDGKTIGNILEESPVIASKRRSLQKSVGLLKECKSTLSKIIWKLSEASK